jgi:pyruvate kinase
VIVGGKLRSHKGVAVPGKTIDLPAITTKDREDASFALKQEVDFLALSYVRTADTVREWQSLIQLLGGTHCEVGIVGKIETREAIDDFDNILECVDAAIVARGDLGVAIPVQEIPIHQKAIIRKCNRAGVPVITATQLLESMIDNPRPTRAETSDVANTILDGTDALLLSGETAVGRYPVRAVEMITKIAAIVEEQMSSGREDSSFSEVKHHQPITDAISNATSAIARDLGARLIVVSTWSGYTARQVARERPTQPIVALTPNHATFRRLALTWGVIPALVPEQRSTDDALSTMEDTVLELGLAERGELIVVTGGLPLGGDGRTNFIKVHRLS